MQDQLKEHFKNARKICIYFALISIILAIILSCAYLTTQVDLISGEVNSNIIRLNAAAIIVLTIILVCVGWFQLGNLNKISKADFLLRIDDRYGSTDIIKARAIVQELYRKAVPKDETVSEDVYIKKISDGMKEIGKDKSPNGCEKFAYLLNLLDFLETIAYFSRKDFISVDEVDDLLGNSLVFYYQIYKPWIYYRRSKYHNKQYHNEIELLVEKIAARQLKETLSKN